MKHLLILVAAAAGLASGAVLAQSDVLKAKGCLNCHDMEKKKVGPSVKDIAAKLKGDNAAAAAAVAKMKEGKGHPKVNASDAELKSAMDQMLAAK